jgi:Holliday junction DNA helicase RuvB
VAIQRNEQTPVATTETQEEFVFENTLRPKTLHDFVGQKTIKRNLSVILGASKKRSEPAPHLLFYGPPGLGKTTLAGIIAEEMGGNLKISSGPVIEKSGDLAAILSNLEEGDVLFIDEIHRLRRPVEEILYSAMEDYALDIMVGKGQGARSMRLQLPRFTLVAATTRLGNISSPLRDRFGENFRLEYYEPEDLQSIISGNAKTLEIEIDDKAVQQLSDCSRGTPRVANRLLQRLRDFAHFSHVNRISSDLAKNGLSQMGVDDHGLTDGDRLLLKLLAEKFAGGPVGLSTLAAAMSEEKETIEDIREPFLLQLGFLLRTPKGRMLSQEAYEFLGISPKNTEKTSLF